MGSKGKCECAQPHRVPWQEPVLRGEAESCTWENPSLKNVCQACKAALDLLLPEAQQFETDTVSAPMSTPHERREGNYDPVPGGAYKARDPRTQERVPRGLDVQAQIGNLSGNRRLHLPPTLSPFSLPSCNNPSDTCGAGESRKQSPPALRSTRPRPEQPQLASAEPTGHSRGNQHGTQAEPIEAFSGMCMF